MQIKWTPPPHTHTLHDSLGKDRPKGTKKVLLLLTFGESSVIDHSEFTWVANSKYTHGSNRLCQITLPHTCQGALWTLLWRRPKINDTGWEGQREGKKDF